MFLQCSRGRVLFLLGFFSLLLLEAAQAAQVSDWSNALQVADRSNTLVVRVTDDTGIFLTVPLRVELLYSGQAMQAGLPDSRGVYRFTGLDAGFYRVRVSHPDYETASQPVSVSSGFEKSVSLRLKPRRRNRVAASPDGPRNSVSLRWLSTPKKARKHAQKARQLRDKQDWKGAARELRKATRVHPGFAMAWNDLGLVYQRMDKRPEGREAFQTAIRENPEMLEPYLNLAEMAAEEKEYQRAAELLQKASQLAPESGSPYYLMANIHVARRQPGKAVEAAERAVKRDHRAVRAVHFLLAKLYGRRGDLERAATELKTYLREAPQGEFAGPAQAALQKIERASQQAGARAASKPNQ